MNESFDFSVVDKILESNGCKQHAIISTLQDIQEHYRYLPEEVFPYLASKLGVTEAGIYSIATFYENFSFEAKGKYVIKVCDGTACHLKGAPLVHEWLYQDLKLKPGETSPDGLFSLETVACLGCCSLAPVMAVNGTVYGKLDRKKVISILKEYQNK